MSTWGTNIFLMATHCGVTQESVLKFLLMLMINDEIQGSGNVSTFNSRVPYQLLVNELLA